MTLLKIANPFDGVTPDFGPFKDALESPTKAILALVWILAIFYVAAHLIAAIAAAVKAAKSGRPQAKEDAMTSIGFNGFILTCLAGAPLLAGVFINMAG